MILQTKVVEDFQGLRRWGDAAAVSIVTEGERSSLRDPLGYGATDVLHDRPGYKTFVVVGSGRV